MILLLPSKICFLVSCCITLSSQEEKNKHDQRLTSLFHTSKFTQDGRDFLANIVTSFIGVLPKVTHSLVLTKRYKSQNLIPTLAIHSPQDIGLEYVKKIQTRMQSKSYSSLNPRESKLKLQIFLPFWPLRRMFRFPLGKQCKNPNVISPTFIPTTLSPVQSFGWIQSHYSF